jgi:uncharacterized protein YceK
MKRALATLVVTGILSGCATTSAPSGPPRVAYPMKKQSTEQQRRDESDCQGWAKQHTGYDPATETARGAGIGAVLGALGGAATGAAVGAATGNAGKGAAVGAVVGGVGGAAVGGGYKYSKSKEGYAEAYGACMSGRGYSVK